MNHWKTMSSGTLAVAACLFLAASPALSDDKPPAPPADPMAEWAKKNAPGPEHKLLEQMAGTFEAHAKFYGPPGQPPTESTGTSVNTMILGGRFLQQEYKASMMGQPFEGVGLTGYDTVAKKYIGLWADSMTTFFMPSEGKATGDGKTLELHGKYQDPFGSGERTFRSILRIHGPDEHFFEMWEPGEDGKEHKALEIHYKRKK